AQVIVAYELLPSDRQLPWSLVLWAAAAATLLVLNHRMRGNLADVAAALWGLVAVAVRQAGHALPGAATPAWIGAGPAVVPPAQAAVLLPSARRPAYAARSPSLACGQVAARSR